MGVIFCCFDESEVILFAYQIVTKTPDSQDQRMVADPHKTPSIMIVLGYAGLLPFVVTALLMVRATWFGDGLQSAALGGFYVPYIFIAYSAVILSFMAGTLWSKWATFQNQGLSDLIIVSSNAVALISWIALLLIYLSSLATLLALGLLVSGFLSLLYLERFSQDMDRHYWQLRVNLTIVVTILHLMVMVLMVAEL